MTGVTSPRPPVLDLPSGIEPMPLWLPPAATVAEVLGSAAVELGAVLARPLLTGAAVTALGPLRSRHAGASAGAPTGGAMGAGAGPPGDPGWFGPDSVAWKVQADASMFVAGIAAFALQLLHPLALAGVVDHSSFADDFLGRVARTGTFVQGVVFGSAAEATRHCEQVRRVHTRVVGTAPDGRPYDANDPGLLEWVHLGEYLAIAAAYRRFGAAPLSPAELDAYVAEVAVVGEAVGVAHPPRSWAELDTALQRHRPALAVGEQTAAALRFLVHPPGLPAAARPAWRVAWAG
ncbi:MAG: oxygenase MpaB family protein, partial [Acidimicrobiales bacterium]